MNPSKVFLAGDHASIELKAFLKKSLSEEGHSCEDLGVFTEASVDYPDQAKLICTEIQNDADALGIFICGTGIGASIAANKMKGIRAALCTSVEMAKLARAHNNANLLCLGARILDMELAKDISCAFLERSFEGGRHQRRVDKIKQLEESSAPAPSRELA